MNYFRNTRLKFSKPSYFFIWVSIIFGGIFVFITPPLQGPDEQTHFLQAYSVSEANFVPGDRVDGNPETYPTSVHKTFKIVLYNDDIRHSGNAKYEHFRTIKALSIDLDDDKRENTGYLQGTSYSPIAYAPHALMIAIGRIFDAPPILLIYMARIGGIAAWVSLVYLAIKKSPIAKWQIAIVGLIPMALFQASVVTADLVSGALLLVFTAMILQLLVQKDYPNKGQYLWLLGVAVLMALSKQSVIVLVPLAFLPALNKVNFKTLFSKKSSIELFKITFVCLVAVLTVGIWTLFISGSAVAEVSKTIAQPSEQIHLLTTAPSKFLFALWNTTFFFWGNDITSSFIGTFGWSDTPMALSFTILGYVLLTVVFLSNRGEDSIKSQGINSLSRLLLAVLGVAYFLFICLTLYVYYTPVAFNIIVGLQGRYFLALLPILLIFSINNNQMQVKPKLYNAFVKIIPAALLFVSAIYIVIRYYFNTTI